MNIWNIYQQMTKTKPKEETMHLVKVSTFLVEEEEWNEHDAERRGQHPSLERSEKERNEKERNERRVAYIGKCNVISKQPKTSKLEQRIILC